MIPKILHQIWIGDPSKRPAKWMETWPAMNPGWEYRLWTEENIPPLRLARGFEETPNLSGKSNFVRYEILQAHGGFYVDADSECIRPLDDDLLDCEAFSCYENEKARPGLIACGFMASISRSWFLEELIQALLRRRDFDRKPSWKTSGPKFLTDAARYFKYDAMRVYPSHYFLPEHFTGEVYTGEGRVYARHYWGSTPKSGYAYGDEIE